MDTYKPPKHKASAFNCPICNAYAQMKWFDLSGIEAKNRGGRAFATINNIVACRCSHCLSHSLWKANGDQVRKYIMIYPPVGGGVPPHQSMPENVKLDFEEARKVFNLSPRGSAALLRLALQKMMIHLGEDGTNIHANLKSLVQKDILPSRILKAIDMTRIVGNESVHPGRMLDEDRDAVAEHLFLFLNLVVEKGIAEQELIDEMYAKTPEGKRVNIGETDE
ncbi:DUF4145 domain-containing protein [Marinicella sediminis]|uniref:DUF4145 domain-containing protein n=1 Tax=Marinicella sediminis TaxID=1792834 RepID=A0ABV7J967_9GAMM|nr:DUF4145 domain-containing protein [Marinicella sediminis]